MRILKRFLTRSQKVLAFADKGEEMKRTAIMVKVNPDGSVTIQGKITCRCTGEMADGTKVWTDVETEEQFFLYRVSGNYIFCHI